MHYNITLNIDKYEIKICDNKKKIAKFINKQLFNSGSYLNLISI